MAENRPAEFGLAQVPREGRRLVVLAQQARFLPGYPPSRRPRPGRTDAPRRLRRHWIKKRLHAHPQSLGQLVQHRDRRVGRSAFDPTQVGAEHLTAVGQVFLRDAAKRAQLLDFGAQERARVSTARLRATRNGGALKATFIHGAQCGLCILKRTHTNSYIKAAKNGGSKGGRMLVDPVPQLGSAARGGGRVRTGAKSPQREPGVQFRRSSL